MLEFNVRYMEVIIDFSRASSVNDSQVRFIESSKSNYMGQENKETEGVGRKFVQKPGQGQQMKQTKGHIGS